MATLALSVPSGYTNTTWMEWMLTDWSYCSQGHMTLQICTLKGTHTAWIRTIHNNTSTSILITIISIVGAMNTNMLGLFSLEDALHAPQWTNYTGLMRAGKIVQLIHLGLLPTCVLKRMLSQCFERWVFWCQFESLYSSWPIQNMQTSQFQNPSSMTLRNLQPQSKIVCWQIQGHVWAWILDNSVWT